MTEATHKPWSYSGLADGDFVVWESGKFVANIGATFQVVSDIPGDVIAFDIDKERAALIVRDHNVHDTLVKALEDIAEGAGPFSRDPLTHAGNCIDYMKVTASAALKLAQGVHP